MEKQKKGIKKTLILQLVLLGIIIAVTVWFVSFKFHSISTTNTASSNIFSEVKKWLPTATWSTPVVGTNSETLKGTLKTSPEAIQSFRSSSNHLTSEGYKEDNSIAADGPGSSVWGYTKTVDGKTTTVTFSFNVSPSSSNPNEPIQFNCPCDGTVSVEIQTNGTSSANNKAGLANPASVNCAKVGGTTMIMNGPNGQYGLCDFGDNMQCEEWALYRGDCPVGGIKTTGFDTIEQKYCAWVGGQTLAVPNATCTFPNGKVCDDTALYNGTCTN